jgi:hypothetical protein
MQPCWSYPGMIFCPTDSLPNTQCKNASLAANSSTPTPPVPFQQFRYDRRTVRLIFLSA